MAKTAQIIVDKKIVESFPVDNFMATWQNASRYCEKYSDADTICIRVIYDDGRLYIQKKIK